MFLAIVATNINARICSKKDVIRVFFLLKVNLKQNVNYVSFVLPVFYHILFLGVQTKLSWEGELERFQKQVGLSFICLSNTSMKKKCRSVRVTVVTHLPLTLFSRRK